MKVSKKVLFIDHWPGIDSLHACGAGLGSSLFKLAALADVSDAGFEVHLLTSPAKKELLEDAAGIDFIYSKPVSAKYSSFEKIINWGIADDQFPDEIKKLPNFHPFSQDDRTLYKSTAHLTFWRHFAAAALKLPVPVRKSKIDICIESEDMLKAAKLMPDKFIWIAISYQSVSPLKDYKNWTAVIEALLEADERIRIVLLGDRQENFTGSERVLNMMGGTSIQLLKALISQTDLLLGVDGLSTNIAMSLNIPSVILFTMISPEHVIADLKTDKIIALSTGNCPYQFCYSELVNYRSSACRLLAESADIKNPECLNFTPESIVTQVLKLLKG